MTNHKPSDSPSGYPQVTLLFPSLCLSVRWRLMGVGQGPRGRARTTLDRRHLIEEDTFEQTSERGGRTRTDRTGEDRLVQDECRCLKKRLKKAEDVAVTTASDQLQICSSHDTRQNPFPRVKATWMMLWTLIIIYSFRFLAMSAFLLGLDNVRSSHIPLLRKAVKDHSDISLRTIFTKCFLLYVCRTCCKWVLFLEVFNVWCLK